jgi:two-component sensor histidine kinase/predicted peroxiredoxin
MPDKFVIGLSHAKNGTNKAKVAFCAANAAIASGKDTIVFLSLEGVRLSQPEYAGDIHDEGFAPLTDLMASFAEAGGQILVCASCLNGRHLNKNMLVPGALIAEARAEFMGMGDCSCCETALLCAAHAELPIGASFCDTAIAEEPFFPAIVPCITERKPAEDTQRLLFAELDHRVNNMLASVQAIASQTLRTAASPAEFVESFDGRLLALGRVHRLLTRSSWRGADFATLFSEQLTSGPDSGKRVSCSGPKVLIEPQTAIDLALVLHELETNARKHGSLSRPDGCLTARWFLTSSKGHAELRLEWVESNGPVVLPPAKHGFGINLIEHSLGHALGGEAQLSFDPPGVTCKIGVPLAQQNVPMAASS